MSRVRVLVGTKKGAFILDLRRHARSRWEVTAALPGWEIYHLKGSPARSRPDLRVAVQRLVRAGDPALGRRRATWAPVGNQFAYEGVPARTSGTTGRRTRGSSSASGTSSRRCTSRTRSTPASRMRRCSARPTAARAGTELSGLREHGSGSHWMPGAGGMCLHTILLDPTNPKRMFIAISAAGAFRTDDGGETWTPINKGLHSEYIPDPNAEVGHCVHQHRDAPVAARHALHAEALGRDAQRRRRRQLARDQRQPAHRLRLPDRRPRARARDGLRRADQERRRALPAGRQAARLSQPHRRQRVGGAHQRAPAGALLRQRAARRDGGGLARRLRRSTSGPPAGRCTARPTAAITGRRSSATCRRCCRSRCRRCHDPGGASLATAGPGARRATRCTVEVAAR